MPLERLTPPAAPPVALARARQFLRVDDSSDDALIAAMIAAAARHLEQVAGLALITSQWRLWADCPPPPGASLRIPLAPISSIDEVAVRDASGWQVVPAADWQADLASRPARLRAANPWPRPDGGLNTVRITFTAGFGADESAVPEELQQAILILAAHFYEFREGGALPAGLPPQVRALIRPHQPTML